MHKETVAISHTQNNVQSRTEIMAVCDSNREDILNSQRMLFADHESLIKNKIQEILNVIKDVEKLCKDNQLRTKNKLIC